LSRTVFYDAHFLKGTKTIKKIIFILLLSVKKRREMAKLEEKFIYEKQKFYVK
jgi:hypothetical protein